MQFSDEQIQQWANEVSDELNKITVQQAQTTETKVLADEVAVPLVPEQLRRRIETATGESAESFWPKIQTKLRDDLCKDGGYLNGEWKKYKDLATKDVVTWTITFLSALGYTLTTGGVAVVPIAIWILHVLLNIGIKTVCDEGVPTT